MELQVLADISLFELFKSTAHVGHLDVVLGQGVNQLVAVVVDTVDNFVDIQVAGSGR